MGKTWKGIKGRANKIYSKTSNFFKNLFKKKEKTGSVHVLCPDGHDCGGEFIDDGTRMVEQPLIDKGFKTLDELGLRDGMSVSSSTALELGEQFLGPGYYEPIPGTGRYVSADGKRVFRMG